uniref:hypothetical protein n=1 Tax=Hyalangium versicolor TaxID=2861190 RepID=UPI001CCFA1DE|nr:hypothetical protein [Hyalangium versicolor]
MATRLILAVLLLVLLDACANSRLVRLDTGQAVPLEYVSPSANESMEMDSHVFEDALTQWVLVAPLVLHSPQQGELVRVAHSSSDADTRWQRLMSKSFGRAGS